MTEPKTVTPRIALAMGNNGEWNAVAWSLGSDDAAMKVAEAGVQVCVARYWITATVPVPEAQEIAGKVEAAE